MAMIFDRNENRKVAVLLGAGSMGTAMGGVPVEKVAEAIRKGGCVCCLNIIHP